jgi:AAA domain
MFSFSDTTSPENCMPNLPEPAPPRLVPAATGAVLAAAGPPLGWAVPFHVGEGLTVLAGRQKIGKTWLAMHFALAVAGGGKAFGEVPCKAGDVLYVDFENGPRRIAARIRTLAGSSRRAPDLARLSWATEAPAPADDAFIAALDDWRGFVPEPRLVVVDGPPRIRLDGQLSRRIWGNDHVTLKRLQRWAIGHGLAVICVCRTRSGRAVDPETEQAGPDAFAAADATLVLDHDVTGALTLHVSGRDVEEKVSAVGFAAGRWSLLGEAAAVRRSRSRDRIIEVLEMFGRLKPAEIALQTGLSPVNTRQHLLRLCRDGEIWRDFVGKYQLKAPTPARAQP